MCIATLSDSDRIILKNALLAMNQENPTLRDLVFNGELVEVNEEEHLQVTREAIEVQKIAQALTAFLLFILLSPHYEFGNDGNQGYRAFLSGRWLFQSLNLSIPSSSFIAITGPSGVGKTSLLRILSGRLSPTEGKVTSMLKDGQDISMIFQDLQLANGASTLNNVLSGCLGRHSSFKTLLGFPKKEKETSIEWLRKFGLEKGSSMGIDLIPRRMSTPCHLSEHASPPLYCLPMNQWPV